ncbi:MAG: 2-C-methyl-D-erythritol 2,4-cyclodiphosphate synthase [Nitrospirales bacterium]|nr:2-C-methyl-D-erythritol 2,4-cyclodiphosphate synthase [Nitrospirales bacterium]
MRIGIGYDSHRLAEGRKLILGGVEIPHERGLLGHSDGDALCHAITDALIGALGEGDIGKHFPDTDPQWRGISSLLLLKHIVGRVKERGFEIAWIDSVIIMERPKIGPHIDSMRNALSAAGLPPSLVSIKAKTNEGMGFAGRGEGVAVHAVCLLAPSPL